MKLKKARTGKYVLTYEGERHRLNTYCHECGLNHVPVFYGVFTLREYKVCLCDERGENK